MNIEEAEERLTKALDNAIALGYTIVSDTWGSVEFKSCCAMGALALLEKPEVGLDLISVIKTFYPIFKDEKESEGNETPSNFWDIVRGFNPEKGDTSPGTVESSWYELGKGLNEKYKPIRIKE